jgi:hypothetical protein
MSVGGIVRVLTRCAITGAAVIGIAVAMSGTVQAQQYDKKNFNFNVASCPQAAQYARLPTVNVDKFRDGSPLPSCGGLQGNTRFKMVWIGSGWAKYGPSVVSTAPARPQPAPSLPHLGVSRNDFVNVDSTQLGFRRGTAPAVGRVINYQGRQYKVTQVIAAGGGNVISHDGGTLVSTNGGNLKVVLQTIAQGGGNVVGPGGASRHY